MTLREAHGNLLDADVDALVNTVNTVGVMGKGIALQFRRAYPEMFKDYERVAKRQEIKLGRVHVWETGKLSGPRFVINFPTKGHWKARSKLGDIETGLADLVRVVKERGIRSVAIPPLGCGNGGLRWSDVEIVVRGAFADLPDVDVLVFPPEGAPAAAEMATGTKRPNMTVGRATLVELVQRYQERAFEVSLVEVQKLMYFLQAAGEELKLSFVKDRYGPYADNLKFVLRTIEGHYLIGYGDGTRPVQSAEPIDVLPGAHEAAKGVLADKPGTLARIDRVLALADGFESAFAMELLSTVHWVASVEDPGAVSDPERAWSRVSEWSPRKRNLFGANQVEAALRRLVEQDWLQPADSAVN